MIKGDADCSARSAWACCQIPSVCASGGAPYQLPGVRATTIEGTRGRRARFTSASPLATSTFVARAPTPSTAGSAPGRRNSPGNEPSMWTIPATRPGYAPANTRMIRLPTECPTSTAGVATPR
jgi:hypothetical protein